MSKRLRLQIPASGPLIPKDGETAKVAPAEKIAALTVAIWKTMGGSEALVVDSAFLSLTRPDYLEDQTRLYGQLNDAIGLEPDLPLTPPPTTGQVEEYVLAKLERLGVALDRKEPAADEFVGGWVEAARRQRISPWSMLPGILFPLAWVRWYSSGERRGERARGPDRDAVGRIRAWGHYLVSIVLGEQLAALRFWYDYCGRHPGVAALTYSAPSQDPCSGTAQAAYSMAKKRLVDDLQAIGLVSPPMEAGGPLSTGPYLPARRQAPLHVGPRQCHHCGGSLMSNGYGDTSCISCSRPA